MYTMTMAEVRSAVVSTILAYNSSPPRLEIYTFRVDGFGSATGAYTLEIHTGTAGGPLSVDGEH